MHDVDEMIERLLDMDIVGADNSIVFTDEAKQLIHEISEECMRASIIVENKDRADEYGKGLSAEDVYVDMLHKIVDAPTNLHRRMGARMLIGVIDQKIQNGETGFRYKPEKVEVKEEISGNPFRWGGLEREFDWTAKEWQEIYPDSEHFRRCHLCQREFRPDEHLYCGSFKQPSNMRRFRILCRECAYSFGKVIEP